MSEPLRQDQFSSAYQTARSAMNRGHSLAASIDSDSLDAAISAYSDAIQILDTLPTNPEINNSLGAALMNRGQLLHQRHGTQNAQPALDDLENPAAHLQPYLSEATPWPRRNYVGALINHANLLLDLNQAEEAKNKAEAALAAHVITEPTDPTDCELAVLATRSCCDASGQILPTLAASEQDPFADCISEQLQAGLAHILTLRPYLTREPFAEASQRLFQFGCLLHARHRTDTLPGFIKKHFQNLQDEATQHAYRSAALEAIRLAVEHIGESALKPDLNPEDQDKLAQTSQELGSLFQQLSLH